MKINSKTFSTYPAPSNSYDNMIYDIIEKQIGTENAKTICKETPKKNKRYNVKWVACFALILLCGTTVMAASNSKLTQYLLSWMNSDEVYSNLKDVSPNVTNTKNNTLLDKQILNEPLWEISDAWYDGVTVYFIATPSEMCNELSSNYDICPSDHVNINGNDCLFECPDAETVANYESGQYITSPSIGQQTGQYHCAIDVAKLSLSDDINVSFVLNISKKEFNDISEGSTKQTISFQVTNTNINTKEAINSNLVFLANETDTVEILTFKLAPSKLYTKIKYNFFGENGKQKAEQLSSIAVNPSYLIIDSQGNEISGGYPTILEDNGIIENIDGSYSLIYEWESTHIDSTTSSLTFIPLQPIFDNDGKYSEEEPLEWAKFTINIE